MAGIGRRRRVLDRRRAALAGRLEGRGAHRDHLLGVLRAHRLHGVAGIDQPLEGVGRDHLDDVGDLHDVEQRRDARHEILARRGRRRDDRVVGAGERDDQRGERLRQHVLIGGAVGEQHLLDAVELGGGFGDGAAALPATSTCTSAPSALAAVSALLVASLSVLLSCSATRSVVIRHPAIARHPEVRAERASKGDGLGARVASDEAREPRRAPQDDGTDNAPSDRPRLVLELVDQLGDGLDLDAGLAPGGSVVLSTSSRGATSTP